MLAFAWLGISGAVACSSDGSSASADGADAAAASEGGTTTSSDGGGTTSPDGGTTVTPEPSCDGVTAGASWDYVDPKTLPDFNATGPGDTVTARGLTGVAYGNGRFVAVGIMSQQSRLLWLTSDDGVAWTKREQALPAGEKHGTTKGVHFINGKFVFFGKDIGTGFRVYTSADGLTWDVNKVDDSGNVVEDFVTDGTTTVMVGPSNSFYRSTDLVHWTPITPFTPGSYGFDTIAFGAGRWVASINTSQSIWTSTDTSAWTAQDNVAHDLRVVFGRGMFVGNSGDGLFTSADGTGFTKRTTTGLMNGGTPFFAGGRFMFLSADITHAPYTDQQVDVSTDGVAYSVLGTVNGHPHPVVWDVAYGRCRYVMAGWSQSGDDHLPWIVSLAAPPAK